MGNEEARERESKVIEEVPKIEVENGKSDKNDKVKKANQEPHEPERIGIPPQSTHVRQITKQEELENFCNAAKDGNFNEIKQIIHRKTINFRDIIEDKHASLAIHRHMMRSSITSHFNIVKQLIGASENGEEWGFSSLYYIITQKEEHQEAIIKNLIKQGFNPDLPMIEAADSGYFDVCKKLIKHGAKVNFQNEKGDTVLHILARAAGSDRGVKNIQFLLDKGANPMIANKNNLRPIDIVFDNNLVEKMMKEKSEKDKSGGEEEKSGILTDITTKYFSKFLENEDDEKDLDEIEKEFTLKEKERVNDLKQLEEEEKEKLELLRQMELEVESISFIPTVLSLEDIENKIKRKSEQIKNSIIEQEKHEKDHEKIEKRKKKIEEEEKKLGKNGKNKSGKKKKDIKDRVEKIKFGISRSRNRESMLSFQKKKPKEVTEEEMSFIKKLLEDENKRIESDRKKAVKQIRVNKKKRLERLKKLKEMKKFYNKEENNKKS